MIVQCEACQTRFRLADEKIKPEGTKVRCSKCKEVFTVTPPEPVPVEEAVDFKSLSSEQGQEDATEDSTTEERFQADAEGPGAEPPSVFESAFEQSEQPEGNELDFSALEAEVGKGGGLGDELADEFSFADTSRPLEDDTAQKDESASQEFDFSSEEESDVQETTTAPTDFDDAFAETEEPAGPAEFDFNEKSSVDGTEADSDEIDFSTKDQEQPSDFSFSEEEDSDREEEPDSFSFEEENDDNAFGFEESKEPPSFDEEDAGPSEFSFDEEASASAWEEESSGEATSFDFEDPQFDDEPSPFETASGSKGEGLQFGEIDFASDSDGDESPGLQVSDDFSRATMELKKEPETFKPSPKSTPSHYDDDAEPLPAPPPSKKSPLSRILVLLVLLLVIVGGAAGFLYMQEGAINLNVVTQYLPFLQEYIGEPPATSPGDRIGISITGSSYVNGQTEQMLVIQGSAINNHPSTRSAITVKGVLLGDKGQTLLQQTVFCGNPLDDAALSSMSFASIEEAMNNQFGAGLSNMNVAAGASIPFTIVFRKIPDGLANINVEVVDSKPGAG